MINLETPIKELYRVGKVTAKRLGKLGISTAKDLLFYFPFRYDDFSNICPINQLILGNTYTIKGRIELIKNIRSPRKRMFITEALISDQTGKIKSIWFNQPYLTKNLLTGTEIFLSGKLEIYNYSKHFNNPVYEIVKEGLDQTHTARIVPIYSLTSNLTQKQIRFLTKLALPLANQIPDWLPQSIKEKYNFINLNQALSHIHFPDNLAKLNQARERLKFDELFLIQLQIQSLRNELEKNKAPQIIFQKEETKKLVDSLPFTLTADQKKTAWQILQDTQKIRPMNRLVEGDVGSGKTIVAVIAMFNAVLSGFQSVYMAPTEILAKQHFNNISQLLKNSKINVGLLTRSDWRMNSTEKTTKKDLINQIKKGAVDLIIGTHALIQEKIKFNKLGLAIIDEQHRFGVEQRKLLKEKSCSKNFIPHLLSMTATPIPRSLALTLYGDLDLSIISQMPKGRKKIITKIVGSLNRPKAYNFVLEEIKKGRQVFVICPLIDPSDKLGVKSVTEEYERLKNKIFPKLNIAMLHGKLKSAEKEEIMQKFLAKKTDLLVSTSVIEVGIDVPNATIMMIEGAERFGLAQLHQFRGRVGRGEQQSYCLLFPTDDSLATISRLKALENCQNGFELAQKDLELRGPGEIYGTKQSGLPELKIASLTDYKTITIAQEEAKMLLAEDPELHQYPLLKNKIEAFTKIVHLE